MTITVEHRGLRSTHEVDAQIEEYILALQDRLVIEEARVRLEWDRELALPYRVRVHLVTPGPDLRAIGCDHTLRAAMLKAMEGIRRALDVKLRRRVARASSNRSPLNRPRRRALSRSTHR